MATTQDVRLGDVIQHPKKYWLPSPVLEIQDKDTRVRFVIPSRVTPDGTTGVTFPKGAPVIVHSTSAQGGN